MFECRHTTAFGSPEVPEVENITEVSAHSGLPCLLRHSGRGPSSGDGTSGISDGKPSPAAFLWPSSVRTTAFTSSIFIVSIRFTAPVRAFRGAIAPPSRQQATESARTIGEFGSSTAIRCPIPKPEARSFSSQSVISASKRSQLHHSPCHQIQSDFSFPCQAAFSASSSRSVLNLFTIPMPPHYALYNIIITDFSEFIH